MAGHAKTRRAKELAALKGEEFVDASTKRVRKSKYYKLTEADHPTIVDGIRHYLPLYRIALKIGCGYSTLKKYVASVPELHDELLAAQEAMGEIAKCQLMTLIEGGHFQATAFYLERKEGWTQRNTIEHIGEIPQVSMGEVPEEVMSMLKNGLGQPVNTEDDAKGEDVPPPAEDTKLPASVRFAKPKTAPAPEPAEDDADNDDDGWGDDDDGGGLF